ncbi:MAG: tRNA (N(6)-L-threonylcarbamoyladenosine(37)-C(2))-methylthiotransferase MtaB [Parvularculaceae bacterium]
MSNDRAREPRHGPQVVSLGCRLNALEGDVARERARAAGLDDAIIVNTCGVTNEAVRQSRQAARRAVADNPGARVFVTGCAAQMEPAQFADAAGVAGVLGNAEKLDADAWRRVAATNASVAVADVMAVRETAAHMTDACGERARAFLQVQNGCDHRCTFCVIPYGRGASRAAPIDDVIDGARRLVEAGAAEIVLTGVDMTSWRGADGAPLGRLVAATLDAVPDLRRLRLSSIDGAEVDDELRERLEGDARLAPHLHISVQSGDDMVLKRMKRRHTRGDVVDLCGSLRSRRPDFAFGADLIAGFPTETDAMFDNTLRLVDEAGLDFLHVFPFSPRDGAPAARMPQVPRNIVKTRAQRLRAKGAKATNAFLDGLAGQTRDGVVEAGRRARLDNFAIVELADERARAGAAARIKIEARDGARLDGSVVETL